MRTGFLGTEMRTTTRFSMATKHLSDAIKILHSYSGPVFN